MSKKCNAETNLNLYILLDISNSMEYAQQRVQQAALRFGAGGSVGAWQPQQDAVGIVLFADQVVARLPPRPNRTSWMRSCGDRRDEGRPVSDSGRSAQAAGLIGAASRHGGGHQRPVRRPDADHGRVRPYPLSLNHEVLLFHIFDQYERDLPLEGNIRFRDLETGEELTTQADGIREKYLEAIGRWRRSRARVPQPVDRPRRADHRRQARRSGCWII